MGLNFSAFQTGKTSIQSPSLNTRAFGIEQEPKGRIETLSLAETIRKEKPGISNEELTQEVTRRRFGEQRQPNIVLETVKGLPQATKKVAIDIGQGIARNIASAGVTLAKPLGGKEQVSAQDFPELLRPLAQKVFRDEPVKSIEQRIAEAEIETKRIGQEIQKGETIVFGKKIPPEVGKLVERNATILAFGGVMGSVGLDLTPFGGLEKNLFRAMIKAKSLNEAISILTRIGIADDLAREFAPDVVKVVDEKTAKNLFNNVANLQKTTKTVKETPSIISKELLPLAQEARKMEIVPLDQAIKKFESTGSAIIGEGKGIRMVVKDEGEFVKVGIDTGGLTPTDIILPSRNFATKEEAFDFIKSLGKPKLVSGISKELEPLAKEARKYKSAEEFVKEVRSDKVFYRGGIGEPNLTKPLFISRNADLALSYSPTYPNIELAEKDLRGFIRKPGKTLDIFEIKNARKFFNEKIADKPISEADFHRGFIYGNWSKIIKQAQKENYDYIRHLGEGQFKGVVDEEFVVLNPQKSLTKLTDFYNQVVRGTKEIPPIKRPPTLERLGLKEPPREITRTEDVLLRERIRAEARGAKEGIAGFKREQKFLEQLEKDITRAMRIPAGKERSRLSFIKLLGEFKQSAVQDAKEAVAIKKPISEMRLDELRTLVSEMKERLRFKMERGFQPSAETAEKLRIVSKESPKPKLDEAMYQQAVQVKQGVKPSILKKIVGGKEAILKLADTLGGAISTRLAGINPLLKTRLRKYEFDVRQLVKKDIEESKGILEGFKNIKKSKEDWIKFDLALKNGDVDRINIILKKYGLEQEYLLSKRVLDSLWERANKVGFDVGYQKDYWPRQIKDAEGFLEYLRGTDAWSLIDEAVKRREMELGRYLVLEERAHIANILIRGYRGGQISLSKTGQMKTRIIDVITPELNQFYEESDRTFVNYIRRVNDAVEARKFFGKMEVQKGTEEGLSNIQDSIGAFVTDLIAKGQITPAQEMELRKILEARFNPGRTGVPMGVYKNLSYIDILGSVTNAITQIGDLAFAMYNGGIVKGLVEGAKSLVGKVRITKEEVGFATRELSAEIEEGGLTRFVDKVFQITGFNKIDRMGAESLINSTIQKAQKESVNPSPQFLKELQDIFPDQIFGKGAVQQALEDLRSEMLTDNVKFFAFNTVLDFSPRALSEMPEQYLRSGNGRIFYMLKTWTLKTFDVYRNEIFRTMKNDKVQGVKNAVRLGTLLFALNATADEIKDFISGRETKLSDLVVDNLAKLVGFSRYNVSQISREGLSTALTKQIAPPSPFPLVDDISRDVIKLFKDFDKASEIQNLRTLKQIPIGGDLYYWWLGGGKETREKEKEKGIEIPSIEIPSINIPEINIPELSI